MKTRPSRRNLYLNLWKSPDQIPSKVKLMVSSYDAYCKKAIDSMCLSADLAESLSGYAMELCRGMIDLINLGIPLKMMKSHKALLPKLFSMGKDILKQSIYLSDLYFIGVFVDLKVNKDWSTSKFYEVVNDLLRSIMVFHKELPEAIKARIKSYAAKIDKYTFREYFKTLDSKARA